MSTHWLGLLALKKATTQHHAKGAVIASAHTSLPGLFHVEQGVIGLYRAGIKLAEIKAGEGFGEISLFSDTFLDVVAESEATLSFWPKGIALLQLKSHAELALAFAALCAQKGFDAAIAAHGLRLRSTRERVLHYLAASNADQTPLHTGPLSQLAARLGLAQESLYRELKALEEEGLITRQQPRVIALNRPTGPASR